MEGREGRSFPESVEPKLSCVEVLVSEGLWVETVAATGWLWTEILFLLQQNSWYFQAWDIARGVRCGLVPPLQPSWVLVSTFGTLLDCVPPHLRSWGQGWQGALDLSALSLAVACCSTAQPWLAPHTTRRQAGSSISHPLLVINSHLFRSTYLDFSALATWV